MSSLLLRRNCCRLCDSPNLELVLPMAPCPPVDAFLPPDRLPADQGLFPMDLYLCMACGHGQLLDVVSPDLLFGTYIYTTSSSPGLVKYFSHYADEVADFLKLLPEDKVVDVGSNDGTLLRFFKQKGLEVLGVDPAESIGAQATKEGLRTVHAFFCHKVGLELRASWGAAKLVTANNVFAHSDDLADMLLGVVELLADDGTFVFEVSYLLDLVEGKVFDFIYHEHLSHHSVKPLAQFMERHGMRLIHVVRTPSKGGSIRCFARKAAGNPEVLASVPALTSLEHQQGLYELETYRKLTAEVAELAQKLRDLLEELHSAGHRIAGYGASATGTVLLHHFDIAKYLCYIVDDNPHRQGLVSPGHQLPIVSAEALKTDPPQYILVLAWRFADLIVSGNTRFKDSGGRFIIPLPSLSLL